MASSRSPQSPPLHPAHSLRDTESPSLPRSHHLPRPPPISSTPPRPLRRYLPPSLANCETSADIHLHPTPPSVRSSPRRRRTTGPRDGAPSQSLPSLSGSFRPPPATSAESSHPLSAST